ncbi:MAG: hypothetical protein MUF45_15910 [Spirosomaceae bacterium]|nr:hypothetical protein [Spirosomataceae bacterium]
MKTLLIKSLKALTLVFTITLIVLTVWANWESPKLSEKLNLKPINLVVFNLNKSISISDSTDITKNLISTNGVTACSVNPKSNAVSVTFYDDVITEGSLGKVIEGQSFKTSKVNFATIDGPKCPIPSEYIDGLTTLKRILCFR